MQGGTATALYASSRTNYKTGQTALFNGRGVRPCLRIIFSLVLLSYWPRLCFVAVRLISAQNTMILYNRTLYKNVFK